jgi:hypothetical protein
VLGTCRQQQRRQRQDRQRPCDSQERTRLTQRARLAGNRTDPPVWLATLTQVPATYRRFPRRSRANQRNTCGQRGSDQSQSVHRAPTPSGTPSPRAAGGAG